MTPSSSAPHSDIPPPPKDTASKSYLESAIEAAQEVLNTLADRVRGTRPADDKDHPSPPTPPPAGTYDQVVGSAKQAVGSALGNESFRRAGEQQNARGRDHTPPSSSPPSGKYNQAVGSTKQAVGAALGNEALRRAGEEQNARGQEEEARRHLHEWSEGVQDRVVGKFGEMLATGDKAEEWRKVQSEGRMKQKRAEEEMDRRYSRDRTDCGTQSGKKTGSGTRSKQVPREVV